ncbi:hypothetical protein CDEST_08544 [Colletotrichum destructivum]|uniref:Uncharacterized protein n=1 Tax=Colletotrichum destructivum TaxID=34406 RepID=A0AAX4IJ74_9PEZI|nr:hypothetical protein CDEST_08544 [Colletotrichum destructivum]
MPRRSLQLFILLGLTDSNLLSANDSVQMGEMTVSCGPQASFVDRLRHLTSRRGCGWRCKP